LYRCVLSFGYLLRITYISLYTIELDKHATLLSAQSLKQASDTGGLGECASHGGHGEETPAL